MKKIILACILLIALLPAVGAVEIISEDNVYIDTPVNDDLFVSGGTVVIDAEVNGDVVATGGNITINYTVTGDVIAAGGQVVIAGDVTGDVFAAGGTVSITGNVGERVVAAGGMVELKGSAEKVILAGGTVTIGSGSVIEKYAFVSGGTVNHNGTVKGDMFVGAETFSNKGTVSGEIHKEEPPPVMEGLTWVGYLLGIVLKIGFFILGLIFIKLMPKLFFAIQNEVKTSWLVRLVLGFVLLILTVIVCVLCGITVILLPLALVLALFFVLALMVSGIIVSYALGEWLLKLLKVETHWAVAFTLGFIIVSVLTMIPVVGFLIRIVVASLGFGAIFYTVKNNWSTITAPVTT
jgi:hypothetical protein